MAWEGWALVLFSAGFSDLNSVTQAQEEKGVGSGQGDLSKDYAPYLHNKEEHWNTWAPLGIQRCPCLTDVRWEV